MSARLELVRKAGRLELIRVEEKDASEEWRKDMKEQLGIAARREFWRQEKRSSGSVKPVSITWHILGDPCSWCRVEVEETHES